MNVRSKQRHDTYIWGRYRNGRGSAKLVEIFDLSETGCQFRRGRAWLEPQDFITLTIGKIGPMNAHVAWTKLLRVGVEFENPLHPSVLNHIVTELDERTKPYSQLVEER